MMKDMYRVYSNLLCGWLREGVVSAEFVEHDEEKIAAGLIGGIDGLWLQFWSLATVIAFMKTLKRT